MGVMCDYFRAGDTEAVVGALERRGGGPLAGVKEPAFDGFRTKGLDSESWVNLLVAVIRDVPSDSLPLAQAADVWPTTPLPEWEVGEGEDGLPCLETDEDDPWATGPWVSLLRQDVRDTLAGVEDVELPRVTVEWVRRWGGGESGGPTFERMHPLTRTLVDLARQARAAEEQLYGWTCL